MAFELFKMFGSIFVNNDEANKSISKTDEKAEGLGKKFLSGIGTAAKWGAGVASAAAAGAAALGGMAVKTAGVTDNIDKMSQKIGISREAYQELDFVCSQSGTSVDNLKAGLKTLTNQMQGASEGSKTATAAFDALGLSWEDGEGKLKGQEEMMWEAFSALQNMDDQTQKAALAVDLFGKAGTELMPMLNGAEGSIESMRQQAHDLGLVLSDESVDAGVKFTDTMDQAKRSMEAIVTKIGSGVMPIFQNALEWVLNNMPAIQETMERVFKAIEIAVTFVGDIFRSIFSKIDEALNNSGLTFQEVFAAIQEVVQNAFTVLQELWELLLKPVFQAIWDMLSIVADYFSQKMPEIQEFVQKAFTDIQEIWEKHLKPCFEAIKNFLNNVLVPVFKFVFQNIIQPIVDSVFHTIGELWEKTLKPVFTNIVDFIKNVFSGNFTDAFKNIINIVDGIWTGIETVIKTPINACIGIINKFIQGLNKLQVPDWVPLVGGKGIDIPEIPLLAKGGTIVKGGKAIVGEAGAELIDLPAGARVTPLTNGNGDVFGVAESTEILKQILIELKIFRSDLYDTLVEALTNGVDIVWSDRELARVVRKYARVN